MRSLFSSFYSFAHRSFSTICKTRLRRQAIALALLLSLIVMPIHSSAYEGVKEIASSSYHFTVAPLRLLPSLFKRWFAPARTEATRERLADRINAVSRITISPLRFVGYQEQSQSFSAQGLNANDQTIQGVRFSWESSDPEKVRIDDSGRARFLQPGQVQLTCRAGSASTSVPVLVRPGARPIQTDEEWRLDQGALRPDGTTSTGVGSLLPSIPQLLNKIMPTAQAQGSGSADLGYDELYTDPANLVGTPLNRGADASRIGAVLPEGSNFEFAVPIIGLGGRGLGTSLTLFYNSRVWSRRSNNVAFDAIVGEPAPGFSLGFGRIVVYDVGAGGNPTCKFMLIDPDGTRHYLGSGNYSTSATYTTTDGTNIKYIGNASVGGTLIYPDGTNVDINVVNNRLLPTQILDTNGNYLTITYKDLEEDGSGGYIQFPALKIKRVRDTLGRYIDFNYNSSFQLTSITAPGFGGTTQNPVTDTIAKFDYQTYSTTTNFSGLTVERGLANTGLKHIYFPSTNNGYLFTYGGYGQITNVSLRNTMSVNGSGVIQDGSERAAVAFNYPSSGSTSQTDVPAFTQRTETALNATSATYSYSSSTNGFTQTKTFTITRPDSSTVNLTRSTNGASVANGLFTQSETKNSGGTTFAKIVLTYTTAASAPHVQTITSYDDTNTPTKVDFDYDSYGNVTNKREYGQQISGNWQVRRRTHFTYSTSYTYLKNLVTLTEVYDAQQNTNDNDDVLIAKSSVTYDDYNAMGGMEEYSGQAVPPQSYNWGASTTLRGNVTGTTQWYDLAGNQSITRLSKYDKYGNVIKSQVACCQVQSVMMTETTAYSQPECVFKGDESSTHTTSNAFIDFNTGLRNDQTGPNASTDPDDETNLKVSFTYDAARRPASAVTSSGATIGVSVSTSFNDSTLVETTTKQYDDLGTTRTITTTKKSDGWGRVIEETNIHGGQVNTSYNAMGQVSSVTNPFTAGGTPSSYVTSYTYDTLGRTTQVTLPDSNTVQTVYSGLTVTLTDQVNRQVKSESDSLGRLVKVTEQDVSTGTLNQETIYSYNLLDKLTGVNQGNQLRAWKYDDLGRTLFEKIPEQTASINDGTGTLWTSKYTYNQFNQVVTRTDARGVITTYSYDGMNRLTGVSYNVGSTGVPSTPGVYYSYDTTEGNKTNGLLTAVGTGGGRTTDYEEVYNYNSESGRLDSVTHWIANKSYTTSYEYNEGGQRTKLTYPSGYNFYLNHDTKGRIQSFSATQGSNTSGDMLNDVTYNIAGQVADLGLGNGVKEVYGYSADRLQLTSQKAGTTSPYTNRMDLTYSYTASSGQNGSGSTAGNSGQLMTISGTINSTTESAAYTYDNLSRLVTSNQTTNGTSAQRRFAYDRWGNRTGVWNATSGGTQIQSVSIATTSSVVNNRIASVTTNGGSPVSYTVDAAGNVTNDGAHSYTYDAENRVVSVDGGSTAAYAYDHQNRRVKKAVSSTTTHYVWEGNQVLAEHNGSTGALLINYTYSGSRMIRKTESGTTKYFLSDKLSARVVLDTSGSVVGRQAHLPFGEDLNTSGTTDKHKMTSYERDSESSNDYAVNRSYSYNIGRFNQSDPYQASGYLHDPQSWNRYNYTANNPVNRIDPTGLEWDFIEGDIVRLYGWGYFLGIVGLIGRASQNKSATNRGGSARPANVCDARLNWKDPKVSNIPTQWDPQSIPDLGNKIGGVFALNSDYTPPYPIFNISSNLPGAGGWFFINELIVDLSASVLVDKEWLSVRLTKGSGWYTLEGNSKRFDWPPNPRQRNWFFDGPFAAKSTYVTARRYITLDVPGVGTYQPNGEGGLGKVEDGVFTFEFDFRFIYYTGLSECGVKWSVTLRVIGGNGVWDDPIIK
jgi:RHS repeat-associated protein